MIAERSGLVSAILLVLVAAVLPLVPAITGEFVAGGDRPRADSALATDGAGLLHRVFVEGETPDVETRPGYHPLRSLSLVIDGWFGGTGATVAHVHSLLWHVLASLGALFLLRRILEGPAALLGALIFAVHPVQVESVAWISARGDVMAAALVLFALLAAMRSSALAMTVAPILVAAALLAGDVALAAPVLVVLVMAWRGETGGWRRALPAAIPMMAVVAAYLLLRSRLTAAEPGGDWWGGSWAGACLTMARGATHLAGSLVLPAGLALDHHVPSPSPGEIPIDAVVLLGVTLVLVLLALRSWMGGGLTGLGLLWLVVALVPVLRLHAAGEPPTADRLLYLPLLGFAVLVGGAMGALLERSPAPAAVGGAGTAFLALLAILSLDRAMDWRSETALWEASLHDPAGARVGGTATSYRAPWEIARRELHAVRAELTDRRDAEEAVARLTRARRLAERACDSARRYGGRGDANPWTDGATLLADVELELSRRGDDRWLAALEAAESAARRPDRGAAGHAILGEICHELGLLERAEDAYARARTLAEGDPRPVSRLTSRLAQVRFELARVALDSELPGSHRRAGQLARQSVGGIGLDPYPILEELRRRHTGRVLQVRDEARARGLDPDPALFRIHVMFGRDEEALPLLEKVEDPLLRRAQKAFLLLRRGGREDLVEAKAIHRSLSAVERPSPPRALEIAETLLALADHALRDGRTSDALSEAREGLSVLRETPAGASGHGVWFMTEILVRLSRIHRLRGEEEQARSADEEIVGTVSRALGQGASSPPPPLARGRMRIRAAEALERSGRPEEAREQFSRALESPVPERSWIEARIRRLAGGGAESR